MTAGRVPVLDLVVVLPGDDEMAGIGALLTKRTESLGIRPPSHKLLKHPNRDPGCFHTSPDVLRPYTRQAAHALVVFDHEGSGQEARGPAGAKRSSHGRPGGPRRCYARGREDPLHSGRSCLALPRPGALQRSGRKRSGRPRPCGAGRAPRRRRGPLAGWPEQDLRRSPRILPI
jgi:hypothetical protein